MRSIAGITFLAMNVARNCDWITK